MVKTRRSGIPKLAAPLQMWVLGGLIAALCGCSPPAPDSPEARQPAGPSPAAPAATRLDAPGPSDPAAEEAGPATEDVVTAEATPPPADRVDAPDMDQPAAQVDPTAEPDAPPADSAPANPLTEPSPPDEAVAAADTAPQVDPSTRAAIAAMDWDTWEPVVEMSQSHASTCLVAVGDTMPSIELSDLDGTTHPLADLLGSSLSVVVFWDAELAFAREQYEQLVREVVEPYGSLGVHVVAINVGDDPASVRELAAVAEGQFFNLLDSQRSAYQSVATAKLPRTYLLDATGKVLWMDIEYSRGTRRELENALRYFLKLDT
jgi:peroxiredoxin